MMRHLMPAFALCLSTTPLWADQVFNDDLIVTGDFCVGASACVDGELFGNSDIKIKSTNAEILFFDTSVNADNLWKLKGDDDAAGALNSFSISNDSTGNIPVGIDPDAPSSAFWISDLGRIGLGTTLPQRTLHIADISTPTIRLERTNGASPYSWDLLADNSAFALRDAVTLQSPLIIQDGASTGDIYLRGDGNLGLGTTFAAAALHVFRSDNTASLLIEDTGAGTLGQMTLRNNGITFFTLEDTSIAAGNDTGRSWNFQNQGGTFRVTTAPGGPGDIEMILTPDGDMTIEGTLTTAGSCSVGCDRVFDADYPLPTIAEHNAEMWANGHLPNVGPTAEDGPFNVSDKMGRMLNELEHAHIFIGQLSDTVTSLRSEKDAMRARYDDQIAALTARLDAIEQN